MLMRGVKVSLCTLLLPSTVSQWGRAAAFRNEKNNMVSAFIIIIPV